MFSDIPLVCSKCLNNKKYVTFIKMNNLKKCAISGLNFFPFSINVNKYCIKTIICKEIAILKLICQVCLLNLTHHNKIIKKLRKRSHVSTKITKPNKKTFTAFFRINNCNNEFERLYNKHKLFRLSTLKVNYKYGIEYLSLTSSNQKGKLNILFGNKKFQFFNLKYFIKAFHSLVLK
mmetsp:Transcript_30243/g.42157  ORF Transcript_30243/g.42157 Transcript_30243/m.42157 type:complete len:177 (+) Transcript_30243:751-1281(+)